MAFNRWFHNVRWWFVILIRPRCQLKFERVFPIDFVYLGIMLTHQHWPCLQMWWDVGVGGINERCAGLVGFSEVLLIAVSSLITDAHGWFVGSAVLLRLSFWYWMLRSSCEALWTTFLSCPSYYCHSTLESLLQVDTLVGIYAWKLLEQIQRTMGTSWLL